MELTPFYGEGCALDVRDESLPQKTLLYLLKRSFGFKLLYRNTWYSNYNTIFQLKYHYIVCLSVVFVHSHFIENPPI
jgi:hypothetical protein